MNEIDWSKAPKWAKTVIRSGGGDGRLFWAEAFGTVSRRQRISGYKDSDAHGANMTIKGHMWTLVETRPMAWTGEGLPPVGAECEVKWGRNGWSRCVVFAHKPNANGGTDVLVDVDGDWTFFDKPSMFRPLRTPEQIAADARVAAIDAMVKECPYPGSTSTRLDCAALYDAGYRKP